MNCANHPDRERVAFCQNCGKPLCTECVRTVGVSTFCEPCLVARVAGAPAPAYGYTPGRANPGQPNPGLAALLGLIPGVGAMYNEQYAKGIVHLMVFAILVSLAHENGVFGLFVFGWIAYMVIEAHHTARARRDGTPLPNPFGLNDLSERLGFGKAWPSTASGATPFTPNPYSDPSPSEAPAAPFVPPAGAYTPPYTPPYSYVPPSNFVPPSSQWGSPQDAPYAYTPPIPPLPPMPSFADPSLPFQRRIPAGAIWLIVLGLLFLFGNTGIFIIHGRYLGPFVLIGIGVWIFVRRMTSLGQGFENDGTPAYSWRLASAISSSIWIFISGVLWLLDAFRILSWSHSWPVFLIAGGILLFFRRTMPVGYGYPPNPPAGYAPGPYPPPSAAPITGTSIVPTHMPADNANATSTPDQEGR